MLQSPDMSRAENEGITVERYLTRNATRIACTSCGNCCPVSCAHKVESSCAIHPKRIGQESRMSLCQQTPVYYFLEQGIACEPVLEEIARLTGRKLESTKSRYPFPHPHRDLPGCVYVDPIDHAQIREVRIHSRPNFIPVSSVQVFGQMLPVVAP